MQEVNANCLIRFNNLLLGADGLQHFPTWDKGYSYTYIGFEREEECVCVCFSMLGKFLWLEF